MVVTRAQGAERALDSITGTHFERCPGSKQGFGCKDVAMHAFSASKKHRRRQRWDSGKPEEVASSRVVVISGQESGLVGIR